MQLVRISKDSPDDLIKLQKILEGAPGYHKKILGQPAMSDQAKKNLSERPPNFDKKNKFCFLVYDSTLIVAFIDLLRGYPKSHYAYLGLLIIPETLQKSGYGQQAYRLIEAEILKWNEIKVIRLGVANTNHVNGFWKKMGFKETGKISKCNEPEIKCKIIEMEKTLKN